jgi:dephospho-CoA kinase
MRKFVLTGGIATGKSYVLERYRRRGIPCIDADELAHGVMRPGTEATAAIAARFGDGILDADGAVNRRALGPLVFADEAARRDLESIVHPAVYRAVRAALRAFELEGAAFAIVAVPLFHETGRAGEYDGVIATVCRPETQLARLQARGLSEAEARQRLAAQLPADEKAARADVVISTDGTFEETDAQADEALRRLVDGPSNAGG